MTQTHCLSRINLDMWKETCGTEMQKLYKLVDSTNRKEPPLTFLVSLMEAVLDISAPPRTQVSSKHLAHLKNNGLCDWKWQVMVWLKFKNQTSIFLALHVAV